MKTILNVALQTVVGTLVIVGVGILAPRIVPAEYSIIVLLGMGLLVGRGVLK